MASITKSQAETDSTTEHDALVAAANQRFIDDADAQILEAIDQGKFWINCTTFEADLDPQEIFDYYANLGYSIAFPDYSHHDLSQQPAQLFGAFWTNFWNNAQVPSGMKLPLRIVIGWYP